MWVYTNGYVCLLMPLFLKCVYDNESAFRQLNEYVKHASPRWLTDFIIIFTRRIQFQKAFLRLGQAIPFGEQTNCTCWLVSIRFDLNLTRVPSPTWLPASIPRQCKMHLNLRSTCIKSTCT